MKSTFFRLHESKRNKIINAAIEEFSTGGYCNSSLDNIIAKAEISKGGLYAYINTKNDLFIYLINVVYDRLYSFIKNEISKRSITLTADVLDRLYIVSEIAFDFYITNPNFVRFIVMNQAVTDKTIENEMDSIFLSHFNSVFLSVDQSKFRFPSDQIFDLLIWMLGKTRMDFLFELDNSNKDISELKKGYLMRWEFYLDILRNGIY